MKNALSFFLRYPRVNAFNNFEISRNRDTIFKISTFLFYSNRLGRFYPFTNYNRAIRSRNNILQFARNIFKITASKFINTVYPKSNESYFFSHNLLIVHRQKLKILQSSYLVHQYIFASVMFKSFKNSRMPFRSAVVVT